MRRFPLLLAFSLFLVSGCCTLPWGPDAVAITPADARTFAILSPEGILLDADLAPAYSAVNGGSDLGEELGALISGTGIDPRTVSKAVRFSLVDSSGAHTAYILQDPPGIGYAESSLASSGAWERTEYGGHSIFRNADRHISFVGGNLVAGDAGAVKSTIDVKNGMRLGVRDNPVIMGMMNRLDQSSPAVIASEMTPAVKDAISSLQGPLGSGGFSSPDSAGLEMKKFDGRVSIRLIFSIASPGGRTDFKTSVYGMSNSLQSMAEPGGALKGFLNKIQVSEDSYGITLLVETTGEELRAVKQEIDRAGA